MIGADLLAPERPEQQEVAIAKRLDQRLQRLQGGGVRPLQIVEEKDERRVRRGDRLDERRQGLQEAEAVATLSEVLRRGGVRKDLGKRRSDPDELRSELSDRLAHPLEV